MYGPQHVFIWNVLRWNNPSALKELVTKRVHQPTAAIDRTYSGQRLTVMKQKSGRQTGKHIRSMRLPRSSTSQHLTDHKVGVLGLITINGSQSCGSNFQAKFKPSSWSRGIESLDSQLWNDLFTHSLFVTKHAANLMRVNVSFLLYVLNSFLSESPGL